MANEVIQIGNKIELRPVSKQPASVQNSETYVSQLLQWSDKNVAIIANPTHKGHLVPLRIDGEYELEFVTRNGLYRCRGKVVKRGKTSNNIAIAEVKFISALEKFQRRQYYRMNCIMPMSYSVLSDIQQDLYREKKRCLSLEQKLAIEKKLESQEMVFEKATALDLSGGGMRFNSLKQMESGKILLIQLSLPEAVRKKVPFLFGRIISSRKIPNKEQEVFDNRIEFVEITSVEQEQLITYIFKEERDKRKREADMK